MTTYTANTQDTSLEDYFQKHTFIYENMPLLDISFKEYSEPETRWEPAYYNLEIHNIEVENKEDYTSEQLEVINDIISDKEDEIVECFEAEMLDPSNYWE